MKLTERDVTTVVYRMGITLAMAFVMPLLALIGQELGVYSSMTPGLVNAGIFSMVLLVSATLWPVVSELIRCSRSIVDQYWRRPSRD